MRIPNTIGKSSVRVHRSLKLFTPTLLAAALGACGGGGDDTPTLPAADIPTSASGATGDITASNYSAVGVQVQDVLTLSAGAANTVTPLQGSGSAVVTSGAKVQTVANKVFTLSTTTAFGSKSILSADGTSSIQAVQSATEPCSGGGSVTVTFNDADNNQDISAGDTMSLIANNCVENGETLNGQANVSIGVLTDTHASMSMQFTNMRVDDLTFTGGVTLALDYNGMDYTGLLTMSNVTLSQAGSTVNMSYTQSASYQNATGIITTSTQGGIVIDAQSYWMQQVTPYQLYLSDDLPFAGALSVTDKDGDRLVGVATTTSMRYEFYNAGNTTGTPDAVTEVPNS
jgi:hypothetical protein